MSAQVSAPQPPRRPFSESPYRAALINAGVAAIAAAALGVVTAYNQVKSIPDLAAAVENFQLDANDFVPPYARPAIIILQLLITIVYGMLIVNFIWKNSEAFDQTPALRYILLDSLLAIAVLVCVYSAAADVVLFRISSVFVVLFWTLRMVTAPATNDYREDLFGTARSYGIPLIIVFVAAVATVLLWWFNTSPTNRSDPNQSRWLFGLLDLFMTLLPLGWGFVLLWRRS